MYAFLTSWISGQAAASLPRTERQAVPRGRSHAPLGATEIDQRWFDCLQRVCGSAAPNTGWLGTLGVTGSDSGDGASTVAANLAIAAARSQRGDVLLIDGNFAAPAVAALFGVDSACGLADLLAGDECLENLVQATSEANLSVLVAGEPPDAALHDLMHLPGIINQLKERYRLVVVDLPPIAPSPFCRSVSPLLDGMLLVITSKRSRLDRAQRAKKLLGAAHAKVLGVVLNERR